MRKLGHVVLCCVFALATSWILGCGTAARLESISISPAAANGRTQFVATGTYTDGKTVSPLTVLWSNSDPWVSNNISPPSITIDATGNASCNLAGSKNTVVATAPIDPSLPLSQMNPKTPQVRGTAVLNCP